MKKFLLVLLSIVAIVIGVGCKENPVEENEPIFPNEATDTVYAKVKLDADTTYNIYKEDMFINLRETVGLGMLVEWADKKIVSTIGKLGLKEILTGGKYKGIEETSYLDLVTIDEVNSRIESAEYPNGKDNYSKEELEELEKDFLQKFYNYGYKILEEIQDYYKVEIAKEKLAKDYQELYRDGLDFGDGDYQDYWKKNYFNEYQMILVPFDSELSLKKTFEQLNVSIDESDKTNKKLVKKDTGEALTTAEIMEVYITLYNNCNLFKESASLASKLTVGKEYNVVNGNYEFNLEDKGLLYYSRQAVKSINSDLRDVIEKLTPYNNSSDASNYYLACSNKINEKYYTVLLISKTDKISYEDSLDEIKEVLLGNEFTSDYVEEVMSIMRVKMDLVIYDKVLQQSYINQYYPGNGFYDGDVQNGDILVAFMEEVLLKETFFNLMDERFGAYTLGELINYYNVLYDKTINDVYDLTKVGPEKDRILDKKEWETDLDTARSEKARFESGQYGMLGYTVGYGWENFLISAYQVRTEKELAFHYLREILLGEYLVERFSLKNYDENSVYWNNYKKFMQSLADEYFKSDGNQIILTYLDGDGNYTSPTTWSEEQVELVEEFYVLLSSYFKYGENAFDDFVELLKLNYSEAPYLIGENNSGTLFYNMDLAKYKTAGIVLEFDDLGIFTNEDDYDAILKAAKELWYKDPSSNELEVYGKTEDGYDYLKSESGYHIYVKLKNYEMDTYEGRNIPTLEEIKLYIKDEETTDLTDVQKNIIKNYYVSVYKELIAAYNASILLYSQQGNCEVTLYTNNYTNDIYQKTLAITIAEVKENIIYDIK